MEIAEPLQALKPTKGSAVTLKTHGGEQLLELNYYADDSPFNSEYLNGEELDHIAFDVQDLAASVKELERRGVEVVVQPYRIGWKEGWREAYVKDPNGIWIELLERK
jgi:catechol 2,3-dioxygenase-like lactoylglutathione lyase family enzyme